MNTTYSIKIVTKLNRETKEGGIDWKISRAEPSSMLGSETLVDYVYTCTVLDKKLRLYKYQSKSYYDEGLYEWIENYRLEFIDDWGKSEWAFPDDRAIYDLYETVRYKTSGVEKFMEKFLDGEKEEEGEEELDLPF